MALERTLATLLEGCGANYDGDPQTAVTGIGYDSRRVEEGHAFVAIPGFVHDGLDFVPDAVAAGARAVVAEASPEAVQSRPRVWARVDSARRALAAMACRWHGEPSHDLTVVGITGTNGKTTVAGLLEHILGGQGPVGRWSTTRVRVAGRERPTARTTPEAPELQAALAEMLESGCHAAAIEVSSHALALDRVTGTRFAAATFTNLTTDHLDFHHDMHEYLQAKAILFESLPPGAPAVLNGGDPASPRLAASTAGRVRRYGWAGTVDIDYAISDFHSDREGLRMTLGTPSGKLSIRAPLFGRINAENVAAAAATALELGIDGPSIARRLREADPEPGRLEHVRAGQRFTALVDYAHTPDALRGALEASRETVRNGGRLLVVFGCGGDRDRAKRPLMGEIAARLADRTWVTSDNPRGEDPESIVEEILAGIPRPSRPRVTVELDRRAAIADALRAAEPGDCVLVAGKGHEAEQVIGDREIPFDDRRVVRELIAAREGR